VEFSRDEDASGHELGRLVERDTNDDGKQGPGAVGFHGRQI